MGSRTLHVLYWSLVCTWLLFLGLQRVSVDGIEHAHVAWLMGERGLRPFNDFFQHHMPLLWEVLRLHYLLGGSGPQVLYFGKGVVLVCAILTLWGFYRIGARGGPGRSATLPAALGGTTFFIAATVLIPKLLDIRPETLATPLFVWSYVVWSESQSKEPHSTVGRAALAGILMGLAFLASPRLLLAGWVFLLPSDDNYRAQLLDFRRLAVMGAGGVAAILAYTALADITLAELHFILSFSSLLQQVGDGAFPGTLQVATAVLALLTLYGLAVSLLFGKKNRRLPTWLDLASVLPVLLLTVVIAGKYVYSQDVIPVIIAVSIIFIRSQNRLEAHPQLSILFSGTLIASWILLLSLKANLLFSNATVVDQVEELHRQLALIPPGESVLVQAGRHPITVDDASFYGNPLDDGVDRLCRAVRAAQADWPLPKCDFLADLQSRHPYLVTTAVHSLGNGRQLVGIKSLLAQHYAKLGDYYLRLPEQ